MMVRANKLRSNRLLQLALQRHAKEAEIVDTSTKVDDPVALVSQHSAKDAESVDASSAPRNVGDMYADDLELQTEMRTFCWIQSLVSHHAAEESSTSCEKEPANIEIKDDNTNDKCYDKAHPPRENNDVLVYTVNEITPAEEQVLSHEPIDIDEEDYNVLDVLVNETDDDVPDDVSVDASDDVSYVPDTDDEAEIANMEDDSIHSDENNGSLNDKDTTSPLKKKKARKGHAERKEWSLNRNRELREHGLQYYGHKKLPTGKRSRAVRPAREMGPPCNCKMSRNAKLIQCGQILDEERRECFQQFWKLSWEAKKCMVQTLVLKSLPNDRRHHQTSIESKRKNTLRFHLKTNGESSQMVRVCKKMFLSTLGLRETAVLDWVTGKTYQKPVDQNKRLINNLKARAVAHEFLAELPKMPSHYIREKTDRLFLEPVWDSQSHLYREFCKYCQKKEVKPISRICFLDVIAEDKISIFEPRKDQCDVCVGHRIKNPDITEEIYHSHIEKKNEAQKEKEKDLADPKKKFVYSMDVQAVMVCPVLKASASYYKTKLAVHNFTFYDACSKEGFCYLWDESQGDLSSNVFATMITTFINENIPFVPGDEIIIWSDGCCYQNRNVVVANALINLAMEKKISIVQKYLEKGHTQMECDSMHSTIKRKFAKKEIYLPSMYISSCQAARIHPKPYNVKYWQFNEFRDYSAKFFNFYSSIRPGSKTGDAVVVDLRALYYQPHGELYYKLRHSEDEWTAMLHRTKCPLKPKSAPQLFKQRLRVEKSKFNHIQALKHVLPSDTHHF